jgi:hypothetical protein
MWRGNHENRVPSHNRRRFTKGCYRTVTAAQVDVTDRTCRRHAQALIADIVP